MLTSTTSNQYLRPEYLSPIQGNSIELDAKKSPLALLAATCSQIGSDGPQKGGGGATNGHTQNENNKSSKDSKTSPCTKSPSSVLSDDSTSTTAKIASFRPYEKKKDDPIDDERSSPSRKTPNSRVSPNGGQSSPSNGRLTPHNGGGSQRSNSRCSDSGRPTSSSSASRANHNHSPHTSSASARTTSSPSSNGPKLASLTSSLNLSTLTGLSELCKDPLAGYKISPNLYPALGLGFDPLGAAGLAALTAKVSTASTSSSNSSSSSSTTSTSSFTTALSSPYIAWTRVKTSSGSETVVPVCRDPYCAGCQVNAHAAQVVSGSCPPGCSQCSQVSVYTKTLSASLPGLLHALPPSTLSSLYSPHSLLGGAGSTGSSQQQNTCNWISGDSYCGKRFNSSEELLQHLRTHTSSAAAAAAAAAAADNSAATLASLHHALHPAHPLLAGHLPRGYPTPPLSPLSASARYHPYAAKPSLTHLPPSAHLSPASALSVASLTALAPHPLSPYYNPYSLYARSLGATAGLHP